MSFCNDHVSFNIFFNVQVKQHYNFTLLLDNKRILTRERIELKLLSLEKKIVV